jgi:hypothetical protein
MSSMSTRRPMVAKPAARFIAMVLFPQPPLALITVIIFMIEG